MTAKLFSGYIFSVHFIICTILILFPTFIQWHSTIDDSDLEQLPIYNALKSADFRTSLYVSLAVSSPMILQLIFRTCVDPSILFSFYKGISNIILVIWIIATDVIILYIAIPHNNVIIYSLIAHLRMVLLCWSAGIYLYLYSESNIWQSQLTVGAFIGINSTRVIHYYDIYFKTSNFLQLANSIFLGISYLIILVQCLRWFYNIRKVTQVKRISTRETYSGVYVVSLFGVIVSAVFIVGYYPNVYYWYQATSSCLCAQTMAYTVFYLIFAVFQENAFEREAQSSKLALEVKQMFIRYMSHEMRTPLNTVMMGLEHLKEEITNSQSSSNSTDITNQLMVIEEIKESCGIALQTLNDMLLHDKIETGCLAIESEPVKIVPLVQSVVKELQIQARQLGIVMSVSFLDNINDASSSSSIISQTMDWENLIVSADTRKLSQVFRNILSNALKFTPRNGSIYLRFSKVIISDNNIWDAGSIKIEIIDSGVGISLINQSKLFHDIIQFTPGQLQAGGGSGLGLYISKGIMDAHHGSLTVSSEGEGKGSTFTVLLPLVSPILATTTTDTTRRVSRTTSATTLAAVASAALSGSATVLPMSSGPECKSPESPTGVTTMAPVRMNDDSKDDDHDFMKINPSCQRSLRSNNNVKNFAYSQKKVEMEVKDIKETISRARIVINNNKSPPSRSNSKSNANSNKYGSCPNKDNNEEADEKEEGEANVLLGNINLLSDKKPVILVVDDVASNRKMLKRLLVGRCSYTIDAVDGQEAVEKVREAMSTGTTIDIITMDYQMPVMDGPTATRKIRELGYSGIILGVTGNVLAEDMKTFLAAGASKVLTKPLSMAIFDATLGELLAKDPR